MDYANGLISQVLTGGFLGEAIERGVRREFFPEERDQKIWDFLLSHYRSYGLAPTTEILEDNYPSYEIGVYREPLDFFIEMLSRRRRDQLCFNFLQEGVELYSLDDHPDRSGEVFQRMSQVVLQAQSETSGTRNVNYVDLIRRSVPEWVNGTGKPTIPFGIPTLDKLTGGMREEQFIVLSGLAKSRKTWTMLYMAVQANFYGFPVLFLTFEMSNDEIAERLTALWVQMSYSLIRDKVGLTAEHQAEIERRLRIHDLLPPFFGMEDVAQHSTVTSLQAIVQEKKPAVVYVDGMYLMTDEITGEVGGIDTKALTNISRGLKRLAHQQKITVVGSTQQLFGKTTRGRTTLQGIGYTSAFGQDAHLAIGVEATEDQPDIAVMRIHANRSGAQGGEFHVTWNLETGVVEEVGAADLDDDVADYDDLDEDDD